jgi:PAS domain S-box-containing protein
LPAFCKDLQGRFVHCNQPFVELFGFTMLELQDRTTAEVAPACVVPMADETDRQVITSGEPVVYSHHVMLRDGKLRDVLIHKTLWRDAQGQPQARWDWSSTPRPPAAPNVTCS